MPTGEGLLPPSYKALAALAFGPGQRVLQGERGGADPPDAPLRASAT